MTSITVFCPMAIERSHIARVLPRDVRAVVSLVQTGIGKHAILEAARQQVQNGPSLLVLAGACGGLTHVADVPPIARVIDEHGNSWTPAFAHPDGVTLIAVDRIIATPSDKAALARSTGASIVDMESHAFAAFCEERCIPWAIVRGVSDTPDETLPHEVLEWIDPAGNTRSLLAARDLLLNPRLVPHILRVVRRSNRVLPAVGRRVCELAVQFQRAAKPSTSLAPGVGGRA